jgi:DNA polymerase IV
MILHADLDAFYASVEQLLDPSLRGRPIAVGGSVVLAASYEARAFGVHGAMPGWRAKRLCPDLIFVSGHFGEYQRIADRVIDVFYDFTPLVERVSIDEAFLDVVGAVRLFGEPGSIAEQIRTRVRDEIGLPISVGVASTKHLAKIGSQVAKPNGLVVVDPDREMEFLAPLPVGLMWGVGAVAQRKLAERGITTIGELADEREVTLFAISVSNLVDQPSLQMELPVEGDDPRRPGSLTGATRWAIDRSMDDIRRKFGRDALGYTSVKMSEFDTVPDEFRELAERD